MLGSLLEGVQIAGENSLPDCAWSIGISLYALQTYTIVLDLDSKATTITLAAEGPLPNRIYCYFETKKRGNPKMFTNHRDLGKHPRQGGIDHPDEDPRGMR